MKPKYNNTRLRNLNVGASLVTAITFCFGGAAHATVWDGSTSQDWNDNTNWVGDAGTVGSNATVNIGSAGNFPIISATPAGNPVDIFVGSGAAAVGRLDVTAGTAATGGGNWMFVGHNGGNGTFNIADTSGTGGATTSFAQGTGSFNVGGRLYIGGYAGTGSTGTLNINTSGTVNIPGLLEIGTNTSTGTVNIDNGIINSGSTGADSWVEVGNGTGCTGFLNMSGGTFTKIGNQHFIVGANGSTGTANISGGTINCNNEFWVGNNPGSNGVLKLSGSGTINVNSWVAIGRAGSASSSVEMTGGFFNHTPGTAFIVGSSGPGTMDQSDGIVDVQGPNGLTWVGETTGATTAVLTIRNNAEFRSAIMSVGPEGPDATLNLQGGVLKTRRFTGRRVDGGSTAETGNGTINFEGTQIIATASALDFMANIDTASINTPQGLRVNSAGFDLTASQVIQGTGGIVKSGAGKLTLSGLNSYAGSNTINEGELVLKAGSTGTGDTTLADGTALGVSQNSGSNQLVSDGITFGVTTAGTTLNLGLGDLVGSNLTDSILDVTGNLVLQGPVTVNVTGQRFQAAVMPLVSYVPGSRSGAGNFTLGVVPNGVVATLVDDPNYMGSGTGLVYLDITSVALPKWDGTNEVVLAKTGDTTDTSFDITVGDATGIAIGQTVSGPGIPGGTTVTAISGLTITLDQAATITDTGVALSFLVTAGTNEGIWDFTTENWVDQVSNLSSLYADPNPVLFDDTATGPTAVVLNIPVTPSEVSFNNSVLPYSVSGSGSIGDKPSGTTSLTKAGTESLTLDTINEYTGVTTLAGGTTTVATLTNGGVASPLGKAGPAASNLILGGGTLDYVGSTVSIDRGFTTAGVDTAIAVPGGTDLTMSGSVVGGLLSSFNKKGDGSLILTNSTVSLGAAGQVNEIMGGTLAFPGPGQTVSIPGELWIGSLPTAAGHLVLDSGSLNVGSWIALGRGNGNTGLISSITATDSTMVCSNFSTGFDNGLSNDSDQTIDLTNTTWTNNGRTALAESANATTNMTIAGTSIYNANDRFQMALAAGTVANVTVRDSGQLNHVGGWLAVGNGNDGVGTLTVRDSGSLTTTADVNVGDVDTATGFINVENDASFIQTGGVTIFIGKNGTTGTVTTSGASTMTVNNTNVAGNAGSTGTLNVKGTSLYTSNGRLQVGPGGGSNGTVVIEESGSVQVNSYVSVGFGGGGSMTVKGSGSFSNNDDFSVNENGDVPAFVTLQDNALMSVERTVFVGRGAGRVGTLDVTGASTLNQTGAAYSLMVGDAGTGTLNIGGTSTVSVGGTAGVIIANNASGLGTVNLDGGTLVAPKVSGGGGSSTFNFNGGLLKAAVGADSNFMSGIDNAVVKAGGANIDTNGENIAFNQDFTNDTTSGNLTKSGTGTMFMNGAVDLNGIASITEGTISGTGTFFCDLVVSAGADLNPGGVTQGALGATSATFTDSTSTLTIDLGATGDTLQAGTLNLNGATLVLNGSATAPVYVIAEYFGSLTGQFAGGMSPPALPSGYTIDYAYNGGTQIALVRPFTAYDTWAAANITAIDAGADATPGGNPDNDGLTNSAEFGLNSNPLSGASSGKVVSKIATVGGVPSLVLSLPVRTGATFSGAPATTSALVDGLIYQIEGSAALAAWNLPVTEVTGADKTAAEAGLPAVDAGWTRRTFTTGPVSSNPKAFMRTIIDQP